MGKDVADSDEFRGARFTRVDFSGATFRYVDFSGATVTDALLVDADLSGLIVGLKVNCVAVAPLVEAELDRLHPERVIMRATTPEGLRAGWRAVEDMWRPTIEVARTLPESVRQQRVGGEWSLVETLRHLIFVTDAWFGHAVRAEPGPYHRLGLVPTFLGDGSQFALDSGATPTFDEVLAVREKRIAKVRAFLDSATEADLAAPRRGAGDSTYPPPSEHTVLDCLHVVTDEEWNHHQYAIRDLAVVTG